MTRWLHGCGYCGVTWIIDEYGSYRSPSAKCKKCGEMKNLTVKQIPNEGVDVFGYRFSPPFLPKAVPYEYTKHYD